MQCINVEVRVMGRRRCKLAEQTGLLHVDLQGDEAQTKRRAGWFDRRVKVYMTCRKPTKGEN